MILFILVALVAIPLGLIVANWILPDAHDNIGDFWDKPNKFE